MRQSINLNWLENMAFETEVNGIKLTVDADSEVGGENRGPRPKPLMLVALAGCTAMDVISILKKMRVFPEGFNVKVDGDLTEEQPKHFTKMHSTYEFKGKDLPMDKIEKAIDLSQERYCGVSYNYKEAFEVSFEIKINEV